MTMLHGTPMQWTIAVSGLAWAVAWALEMLFWIWFARQAGAVRTDVIRLAEVELRGAARRDQRGAGRRGRSRRR
jgi:hypothetical protein